MKSHISYLFLFTLLIILFSCGPEKSRKADLNGVPEEKVAIDRYEEVLFNIHVDSLQSELIKFQSEYLFFLGGDLNDPKNISNLQSYLTDPFLKEISDTVAESFIELSDLEEEMSEMFRYYRYYFPGYETPQLYTYVSGLYYEQPVIFSDSVMVIGLDLFLGANSKFYSMHGIPSYKSIRMTPDHISTACAMAIADNHTDDYPENPTLLDLMVYHGKKMLLADLLLPEVEDHIKIGFSPSQNIYCINNEKNMWSYIIEHELLFKTDYDVNQKFITDGPFTSLFSRECPARTGQWLGWQMLRSYYDRNPNKSLAEILAITDSNEILKDSGYRP